MGNAMGNGHHVCTAQNEKVQKLRTLTDRDETLGLRSG